MANRLPKPALSNQRGLFRFRRSLHVPIRPRRGRPRVDRRQLAVRARGRLPLRPDRDDVEADGPVDATQIVCADVPAGTYQPSIVCVDAAGNALTPAVLATDVLVVNDVATVMVNVPASLAASLV
jgi:hypothetical protein